MFLFLMLLSRLHFHLRENIPDHVNIGLGSLFPLKITELRTFCDLSVSKVRINRQTNSA